MNCLLDTHILLWWYSGDRRLRGPARDILSDPQTTPYVSAASLWEVVLKSAKGRLSVNLGQLVRQIEADGLLILPIGANHVQELSTLPLHHPDPFDRILVAQAQAENLRLLTSDTALAAYGEVVLLV